MAATEVATPLCNARDKFGVTLRACRSRSATDAISVWAGSEVGRILNRAMQQVAQFGNEHVSDLAVHPTIPGLLAVSAVDGSVHRYARFTREKAWSTSISNPRICWVEDKILVWGAEREGLVLNEDGSTVGFEIPANSDLVVAGSRLLIVSAQAGLFSYQLSSAQPVLREKLRNIDGYRSIVSSATGAIALAGGPRIFFQPRADCWFSADPDP